LKDQPVDDYSIEVASLDDSFKFKKDVKLNMNTKKGSLFIQTDKSIYKPADTVNFRVVVLNEEMRPRENIRIDIFITDGADNRIKQYDNVKLYKGVYENRLDLSDLVVTGYWNIHVNVDGKKESSKSFEVNEYVLPKFETFIVAPDVSFKDG
jgi:CD109 antigen